MATALQFFVHGQHAPLNTLNQKLEQAVQDLNGHSEPSSALNDLAQRGIAQVAVGPNHLCFLLDDGTVHRLSYSVDCDLQGTEVTESAPSKKAGFEPPVKKTHLEDHPVHPRDCAALDRAQQELALLQQARRAASRPPPTSRPGPPPGSHVSALPSARRVARRTAAPVSASTPSTVQRSSSDRRVQSASRAGPLVMEPLQSVLLHRSSAAESSAARRLAAGPSAVPEEFISQVQQVLQGKSRRAIIRELLRTNLDVNTAANNLLSRDDDDMSESEELASEAFADEMLIHWMDDSVEASEPSFRSRHALGSTRDMFGTTHERSERTQLSNLNATVRMGDKIETLRFASWEITVPKFTNIAVLLSELLCVDEDGQLYQWRWEEEFAYDDGSETPTVFHPKTISLGLKNEKIRMVASSSIRASFVTVSGKLATLMDDTVAVLARKLEHPATSFMEVHNEKISELSTSFLYSCIRVESGSLFWWGVMPLGYRHRSWDKSRSKPKKTKTNQAPGDLQVGSTVIYKGGAFYQPGALGFRISIWGELQCGELIDNMWDLTTARFRILDPKTGRPLTKASDSSSHLAKGSSESSATGSANPLTESLITGKRAMEPSDEDVEITEQWPVKEVVIIEENGKSPLIGKITKTSESDHVYVVFTSAEAPCSEAVGGNPVEDARYIKKCDLQLVKSSGSASAPRTSDSVQRTPKKLRMNSGCKKILACAPNTRSIQMIIMGVSGKLSYVNYNLQSGKKDSQSRFSCDAQYVTGRHESGVKLLTGGRDTLTVMLDGNQCFYPLEKDSAGNLKSPHPINCSPVHSLNVFMRTVSHPTKPNNRFPCGIVLFAIRKDNLVQAILENDVEKVRSILHGSPALLERQIRECADGNRNIFHACIAICAPQPRKDFPKSLSSARPDSDSKRDDDLLDMVALPGDEHSPDYIQHLLGRKTALVNSMARARARDPSSLNTSVRIRMADAYRRATESIESLRSLSRSTAKAAEAPVVVPDPGGDNDEISRTRTVAALTILEMLCASPTVRKIFLELMALKNSQNMTPFMYAILIRSYEAALILLKTTVGVIRESYPEFASRELTQVDSKTVDALVMDVLYPLGSHPDDSPLFVLCLNDVCTYTWTGACHIQQDVWECRTCGLTGTLCCCTECARTCHRGHDCKIKRSSPTAYCDCWEKCKCQSLVSGDEVLRLDLFSKLVGMSSDLVVRPNSRGEFLLQYLVHTVGRQLGEQRYLKINRGSRPPDLLSPPKFCQMALTLLLGSYEALKTALLTGYPNPRLAAFSNAVQEDQFHLSYQSGTASLDKFIHVLLTKCSTEHIDAFIETVQKSAGDLADGQDVTIEAQEMTSRFVRSIVRVFVVLTCETVQHSKKSITPSKPLQKIRKIFRQLPMSSVIELCEAAEALIAPVRQGVARPTSAFTPIAANADGTTHGSDELFNLEPLAERRRGRTRRETQPSHAAQREDIDSVRRAFEDDFPLMIPETSRSSSFPSRPRDSRTPSVVQPGQEEPSSGFSAATQAIAEGNMSDMDIDEEADSEGTDSDNGEFNRALLVEQRMDRQPEGAGSHDTFSEPDNDDDDDNDDSDPSTGTHEEDEDDEEEDDAESDGLDMDESGSVEGDEEHLYPFFAVEGGAGRSQSGLYVRNTGGPTMSVAHRTRASGTAPLPHGMQWAVRQSPSRSAGARAARDLFASSSGRGPSGAQYIYMDSFGIMRPGQQTNPEAAPSSFNSAFASLARSYGMIIREIAELMAELRDPALRHETVVVDAGKMERLENFVDESLKRTWSWMCQVMDSTEAQLRFGYALHQSSDTTAGHAQHGRSLPREHEEGRGSHGHPTHRKPARDNSASSRNDFLSYMLSLMRSHNSEHGDSLPVVDVAALKHVALVFDAVVYYIRMTVDASTLIELRKARGYSQPWGLSIEEEELEELTLPLDFDQMATASVTLVIPSEPKRKRENERNQTFFRRSRSMCYLGSAQADPFVRSLAETMPLADKPQLLLPNSRREELFGTKLMDYSSEIPSGSPACFKSPAVRLSLTSRQEENRRWLMGDDSDDEYAGEDEAMDTSEAPAVELRRKIFGAFVTQDLLLGRWRQSLDLFSRVFAEDFSTEPGSLIHDIAPFAVKEARFRRDMERMRGSQTRDFAMEVQRSRGDLIPESFAALNAYFGRRSGQSAPVPCSRIKVTFRDEPGEGNGVARSFFTVIAEALLSSEKLPQLDRPAPSHPPAQAHDRRYASTESVSRLRYMRESGVPTSTSRRSASEGEMIEAELRAASGRTWADAAPPYRSSSRLPSWTGERPDVAESLIHAITTQRPHLNSSTVQRIASVLMQLDIGTVQILLQNEEYLGQRVDEAASAMQSSSRTESLLHLAAADFPVPLNVHLGDPPSAKSAHKEEEKPEEKLNDDDDPMFYDPGRAGFYAPRPGKSSPARLTAFRNVGRLIGLALLQGEIFPLCLTRASVKYLLDRPRTWSDFAFHDPVMYETLRKLVFDAEMVMSEEDMAEMCLYFSMDLSAEEGGKELELKTFGSNLPVTRENIYEFVKLATEARMLKVAEKSLEAMKKGLHDVVPAETLEALTPEDFRLLLNGVDRVIDIQLLASWTNWQDETNDKTQDKTRFKHWFWNTVDKFTNDEKQELLYFWTGSSAMPASEAGFSPLPSITIRPADDIHLPTANTCISRLYIPHYSNKAVMRAKLLVAVKTKNFGFV